MNLKELLHKVQRKWMKIRLQPIRIFCLHHVCVTFDPESMETCDWMQIDEFKSKITSMQQDGVKFISLTDAYRHMCNDWIRCKKYAVLTFDDGYASLKEVLPWLEEQNIPATLFINGKYLDGKSYRLNPKEKYITQEELFQLISPLIEIGSHGWEHQDASQMDRVEFEAHIDNNINLLSAHLRYIPFHAYTWGRSLVSQDVLLQMRKIIPVYIDGVMNYNNQQVINRELI